MNKSLVERDASSVAHIYSAEPIVMINAEGMYLFDCNNKAYLDFSAQYSACSVAHNHSELISALNDQMKKLTCVTTMFVTEERVILAELLRDLSPPGLTWSIFGCTGSDAMELALKCIKIHKKGGDIISFRRGFHGSTAASAGVTGKVETIQEDENIAQLLPSGFHHAAPAYCYRCDFQKQYPDCSLYCLDMLEEQIIGIDTTVSAIVTEPIFASGGVIVPPEGYFERLRKICDDRNILLVFDEIVSGVGQTGYFFACEHWDVSPDILVTGKALTGGYIPGSAVLMTNEIAQSINPLTLHGHTHSCYPLMCTSAIKNLEIISRDNLIQNAAEVGKYLHRKLLTLLERFGCIGDIRGLGLLQGLEIVKNRDTKEADYALGRVLFEQLLQKGLITELESRENLENCVIVLHPPLITSTEDVDQAVSIIEECLEQLC